MKKLVPLALFKVYCNDFKGKRREFFWCSIWPTLREARVRMREIARQQDTNALKYPDARNRHADDMTNAAGACFCWSKQAFKTPMAGRQPDDVGILLPEMGEIVLANTWAGSETASHECCHAAHRLAERIIEFKLEDDQTTEERFCLTVGWMTRQIIWKLNKLRK